MADQARIAATAVIGQYTVIEEDVSIGDFAVIGHHAVIHRGSVIGDHVRIDDFACVGKLPMAAANSAVTSSELPEPCRVCDHAIIGTGAILYRGAEIGKGCLIADQASIREAVKIGEKSIIGRNATIENCCRIGRMVKIQSNAYITAYSEIEDFCFIAPGVITSNDNYAGRTLKRFSEYRGVVLKKGARLGAGTVILPGKTIDEDGFVAAGSVVTRHVSKECIVMGNPAREKGRVKEEQLLKNQKGKGWS